jgi:hypothetical protein
MDPDGKCLDLHRAFRSLTPFNGLPSRGGLRFDQL